MKNLKLILIVGVVILFSNNYLRADLFGDLLDTGKKVLEKDKKEKEKKKREAREKKKKEEKLAREKKEKERKLVKEQKKKEEKEKQKKVKLTKAWEYFSNNYITQEEYNKKVGIFFTNIAKNKKVVKKELTILEGKISNRIENFQKIYLIKNLFAYTNNFYSNFVKKQMDGRKLSDAQKELMIKIINKKWKKEIQSKGFISFLKGHKNFISFFKKNKIVVSGEIKEIGSTEKIVYKKGVKKYLQKINSFIKKNKKVVKQWEKNAIAVPAAKYYGKSAVPKIVQKARKNLYKDINKYVLDYSNYWADSPYSALKKLGEKRKIKFKILKNNFSKKKFPKKIFYYLSVNFDDGSIFPDKVLHFFEMKLATEIASYYGKKSIYDLKYEIRNIYSDLINMIEKNKIIFASRSFSENSKYVLLAKEDNLLNYQEGQKIKVKVNYSNFINLNIYGNEYYYPFFNIYGSKDLQEKDIVK